MKLKDIHSDRILDNDEYILEHTIDEANKLTNAIGGAVIAGASLLGAGNDVQAGNNQQTKQVAPAPVITMERLIDAIAMAESSGNPSALGDKDKNGVYQAWGLLQIHPVMVAEVNRISGQSFKLSDRLNPDKSKQMFRIYANHYSRGESADVIARRWNGGPNGDENRNTIKYWRKVERYLRDQKGNK